MKKTMSIMFLIFTVIFSVQAEEESSDISLSTVGPLLNTALVGFPLPTGAVIGIDYTGISVPWSDNPLKISLLVLCGYPSWAWYRNPDGSPLNGAYTDNQVVFDYFTAGWQTGVSIPFPFPKDSVELAGFLFIKGWYNDYVLDHENLLYSSSLPDRDLLLSNSFLTGISLSDIAVSSEQLIKGIETELSFEWHPDWPGDESLGSPDFIRLNFQARTYYPLVENTPAGGLYFADQVYADYLAGDSIPFYESSLVGGTAILSGLGGLVRGYEDGAYDTQLKLSNNLEFRWVFPGLIYIKPDTPLFRPVVSVFADAGYYSDYFGDPSGTPGGFLFSAGAGVHVTVFNILSPGVYMTVPIAGSAVNREPYSLSITFSLHFSSNS